MNNIIVAVNNSIRITWLVCFDVMYEINPHKYNDGFKIATIFILF